MNNWFITDYKQVQLDDGFRIEFTTDWPAHLFCYWTTKKPWVHRRTGDRRGLLLDFFAYFCFVSWNKLDQLDPGGTYYHCFELHDWPYCETRWFVFSGEIYRTPAYWEPWGVTLRENHDWVLLPEHSPPDIDLTYGKLTYSFSEYESKGLRCMPFDPILPFFNDLGVPICLNFYYTHTEGNPLTNVSTLMIYTQNHFDMFTFQFEVSLGDHWKTWGENKWTHAYNGFMDIGQGPYPFNLVPIWQELRRMAGWSDDPTGWTVYAVRLEIYQVPEGGFSSLTNDYIDLFYPILNGGPMPPDGSIPSPHDPPGPEISPSVSPIFEKHNWHTPPPTGHFVASTHILLKVTGINGWHDILWYDGTPLKDHLPETTVALCLHCGNSSTTRDLGLRPKGSIHNIHTLATTFTQQWAFVGVNENIEAEAYITHLGYQKFWLEGYVLKGAATMFTNPKERTPEGDKEWVTVNVSDICPDAIGIIAEISMTPASMRTGIRYNHSPDDRDDYVRHIFPVIGCDRFQQIEFYTYDSLGYKSHLYILGYITAFASFFIEAPDKTPTICNEWQTINVDIPANLAFFEINQPASYDVFALRATGASHNVYRSPNPRHCWAIIPPDKLGNFEAKVQEPSTTIHQIGEGH